jgi:hypothetical protein
MSKPKETLPKDFDEDELDSPYSHPKHVCRAADKDEAENGGDYTVGEYQAFCRGYLAAEEASRTNALPERNPVAPVSVEEIWNEPENQQQIEMLTTNFWSDPRFIAEKAFKSGWQKCLDQNTGSGLLRSNLRTGDESKRDAETDRIWCAGHKAGTELMSARIWKLEVDLNLKKVRIKVLEDEIKRLKESRK